MSHELYECRCWLKGETESAILVEAKGKKLFESTYWIPRLMIKGGLRKEKAAATGATRTEVIFKLPEWFLQQKNCWDLVP